MNHKKSKSKRFLSVLLSVLMLVTTIPLAVVPASALSTAENSLVNYDTGALDSSVSYAYLALTEKFLLMTTITTAQQNIIISIRMCFGVKEECRIPAADGALIRDSLLTPTNTLMLRTIGIFQQRF